MANFLFAQSNREPVHAVNLRLASTLLALCEYTFRYHPAGPVAEAIRLYERILALKADFPEIPNNLRHVLGALGRPAAVAAAAAWQRAIELKPDFPEAPCTWGLTLTDLDQFDEARPNICTLSRSTHVLPARTTTLDYAQI